jgi:hypothetical protein
MLGRGDDDQRVVHEVLGHDVQTVRRAAGDRQIGVVVGQRGQDELAVRDLEAHAHTRVPTIELCNQARQKVVGGGHHGQSQQTPFEAAELVHGGIQVDHACSNVTRVPLQLLSCFGQEHALAHLFEQRQRDLLLQLLHLHRHGRLRQVQFGGGPRDGAAARHRFEDLQMSQGDVHGVRWQSCMAANRSNPPLRPAERSLEVMQLFESMYFTVDQIAATFTPITRPEGPR